jgi:hypothetical protein
MQDWKPFINFLMVSSIIAILLGGWNLIELGACKAKYLGTWGECAMSILCGVDYVL